MISWGVKSLDKLTGGIENRLTCIYGPTASGKTTLSTYIPILQQAKRLQNECGDIPEKARFIVYDGDGGFSFERLEEILDLNKIDKALMKQNLVYHELTEFDEQHKLITKELEKQIQENEWKPVLISLDPAIAIYRGIILRTPLKHRASTIGEYTGKLDKQVAVLRHLSVLYRCPVFVTSWPPSPVGEALGAPTPEAPMIGGREMVYLPKIIIELGIPDESKPERTAKLIKHRSRPVGLEVKFKLCDAGISDV